ncbi:MAG: hypothetical protein GEV12_11005 [Micromonosporaceae bacterium]|nr:hypothetical protein [Micromonosporaceae bacterium]
MKKALSRCVVMAASLSMLPVAAVVSVPSGPAHAATVINVADYQTGGRSDSAAIQAAIDAAAPGDTVYFPGGTYHLDAPFRFGSGVNHIGEADQPAVLLGTGATSLLLRHTATEPLHDVTIRGLHFDNIEVQLSGTSSYSSFTNVTFQDCLFRNGRRAQPWESRYLALSYTVGVTVDRCTFLRTSDYGGLGVQLSRTKLTVIKDSWIGTTSDLEAGTPNGYFKTAVNVFGYGATGDLRNKETVIDGNVWRRAVNVSCPTGLRCEDHGLYAWGADGLFIQNNYADGWTNTSSGGSLKLRNGEDTFAVDNHLMRSGILSYTHWHGVPQRFHRARIEGNRVDMLGADPATGIFYRRVDENGSSSGSFCDAPGGDDDIYIVGNELVDGSTLDVRCATGAEVCVHQNEGADLRFLVPNVRTTGCLVPDGWDRPLAGVHRGDFNGDGQEDFLQRTLTDTGGYHWRAHLSSGDGYADQDWGDDVRLVPGTEEYGVHVADFNGDGRDDLAYRGVCGSASTDCWRVHRSTGTGFMAARGYGDGVYHSDETFRFGFHPGDYNRDGRADLAFRGNCGNDGHPCWRVLASQSDGSFTAQDWGDGKYWDPTQTDGYGLLVGDYNGDGRDDIAYRGLCGSTDPCLRVHVSTVDDTFVAQGWGGGFYLDGPVTAHFGMRVVDANGDGYADIGYRGRCGSPGVPRWRFHLGGDTYPFTIACSESAVQGRPALRLR